MNIKAPGWDTTQTVASSGVKITSPTSSSLVINRTPILYTGDGGYYEVLSSLSPGGPYTSVGITADKIASNLSVIGLTNSTTNYFVVRTLSPDSGQQQNTIASNYSAEASGTTADSP
ncbi:MAG: hypothetical protein KAI06_03680 [Anaerolineales bacterium]|nr:hypothetical protein [Anaerolineales bacterium]